MRGSGTEPTPGQDHDLCYISRLAPEGIRARLAEQTKPYQPNLTQVRPLLLKELDNGDFYLVSTGYHYFMEACGIALLHLAQGQGGGETVIEGDWKKKVPFKPRTRDVLILILGMALLVLLQFISPMDIHGYLRGILCGFAGGLGAKIIVHFTAPKYRVEEQKKLQTFIEQNLLD